MNRARQHHEEFDPRLHTQALEAQTALLRTECERLQAALGCIRDDRIPQGMSPALFAERVLRGVVEGEDR